MFFCIMKILGHFFHVCLKLEDRKQKYVYRNIIYLLSGLPPKVDIIGVVTDDKTAVLTVQTSSLPHVETYVVELTR